MSEQSNRPEVLNNLSTTEAGSLETLVSGGDEAGFTETARSYGWDDQTIGQAWQYMTHKVSEDEAQKAFGSDSAS